MLWPLETAAGRGDNRGSTMKLLLNVWAGSAGGGGSTPPHDRAIPGGGGFWEKPAAAPGCKRGAALPRSPADPLQSS